VSPQGAARVRSDVYRRRGRCTSFVSIEGRHEVCELCAARGKDGELGWLPPSRRGRRRRCWPTRERKPGFLARMFRPTKGRRAEDYFAEDGNDEPANESARCRHMRDR